MTRFIIAGIFVILFVFVGFLYGLIGLSDSPGKVSLDTVLTIFMATSFSIIATSLLGIGGIGRFIGGLIFACAAAWFACSGGALSSNIFAESPSAILVIIIICLIAIIGIFDEGLKNCPFKPRVAEKFLLAQLGICMIIPIMTRIII